MSAIELAQTLVRSVARAFYSPKDLDTRHILIVDAVIFHSTLRDDDLSFLMNMNLKDLHRICARLRDDRLLHQHNRPEIREGQQRPSSRTYYFIDYRQAIDAIKWRVYTLDKAIQKNSKPSAEKKEYFCTVCKSEWTQMEVLDKMDHRGFLCHRCSHVLHYDPDREVGGHEQSTKLNNQLKFITDLLPQLDSVIIPDNNFDVAYLTKRDVQRDEANKVAASTVVESLAKPTAVRGLANTGPSSIAISITDTDAPTEAEKEAERLRKEKIAASNALPTWHTTSTVTGASLTGDNNVVPATAVKDEEDVKKSADDGEPAKPDDEMDQLFNLLRQNQAEAKRKEAEEDEEEEESGDDEDEEFEDIPGNASSVGEKRHMSSGATSAADTPASDERPSKKVKVVEQPVDEADSDDEEAFEDV
ncbi:hypothetical protein F4778DRAFT_31171 [Xylariomycetidae sp. FL2044]|nr:hypothetical protein F4778DRAFT_31171 [Xylariomycetidae sp. FL2044]